jgi:hypothetical protein
MLLRHILIALILIGASPAGAQKYDGNKLVGLCTRDQGFVVGYVAGLMDKSSLDVNFIINQPGTLPEPGKKVQLAPEVTALMISVEGYCLPAGVSLGQATDVFCKYLKDNPAERPKDGAYLVGASLKADFPCVKQ